MEKDSLQIVKAETQDQVRQIASKAQVIWRQHFTPIIGEGQVAYMLEKFQSESALTAQLQEGYEYYQLLADGCLCGYLGVHAQDGELFLSKLYIEQAHRGQGIARRAFAFLQDLCARRGLHRIWLTCNKHNENTLAVYRHLGFKTIDTQQADIGGGYIMDDYIMEYRL